MKLSKALKEKNKLIGEINELRNKISGKNSYIKDSVQHFDLKSLYELYHLKVNTLIELKTQINKANQPIQNLIYLLSELKSEIQLLNGMSSFEGTRIVYGKDNYQIYDVVFNEKEIEEMKNTISQKIENIQESIDSHNYITEIDF